jgi:hypothetical protein
MHFPAIKVKIFQLKSKIKEKILLLPRSLKILFLILLLISLFLLIEVGYLLWSNWNLEKESRYINPELAYQKGVYLHSKGVTEEKDSLLAIRGKVVRIDGLFLTIENRGQRVDVEMYNVIAFTDLRKETKTIQENEENKGPIEAANERFISPEDVEVDDLSQLIKVGDFVVVGRLNEVEGVMRGGWLSVLDVSE